MEDLKQFHSVWFRNMIILKLLLGLFEKVPQVNIIKS